MKREDLTLVGEILKAHGINGELLFRFHIPVVFEDISFFFVEIDGLPVPFRISEITPLDEGASYVRLERINNREEALSFTGFRVFVEERFVSDRTEGLPALDGFYFQDETSGKRGTILHIIEIPENPLMEVQLDEQHYFVPLHTDFIVSYDQTSRIVILALPEGIFEAK